MFFIGNLLNTFLEIDRDMWKKIDRNGVGEGGELIILRYVEENQLG